MLNTYNKNDFFQLKKIEQGDNRQLKIKMNKGRF